MMPSAKFVNFISLIIGILCATKADGQSEINSNTHVNHNVNTENYKIGNSKVKNYNIQESNYQPTQLTQVVLNLPKMHKKLRRTRPASEDEILIKQRIVDIYNEAKSTIRGYSPQMEHLGRIIEALNPKYIATERVVRALFNIGPNLSSPRRDSIQPQNDWSDDVAIAQNDQQNEAMVIQHLSQSLLSQPETVTAADSVSTYMDPNGRIVTTPVSSHESQGGSQPQTYPPSGQPRFNHLVPANFNSRFKDKSTHYNRMRQQHVPAQQAFVQNYQ